MTIEQEQEAQEKFYDNSSIQYEVTAYDSDGEVLAYVHGCDYEDLAEQSLPQFAGQVVYTLSATANDEEVLGKVTRFTFDACLEGFMKVEAAVNELLAEQFEAANEVDYDLVAKEVL